VAQKKKMTSLKKLGNGGADIENKNPITAKNDTTGLMIKHPRIKLSWRVENTE
jgi:hypothetical protein